MTINYTPLWKTLLDKGIKKTELCQKAGLSTATVAKMSKNQVISLEVIIRICEVLDCKIEQVCEVI